MFSNAVKLFKLIGFDIKLDPSWILIAALITWSLSQQYFPATLPGQTAGAYFLMAVFAMLLFFASLLLHELAHAVVARQYGVPIKGITLFLFGGVAELDEEPRTAGIEFRVAVAGPLMSFALSFGFWSLALAATIAQSGPTLIEILSYLATINLILALFNLVPAFPLDGGRVLRAYLWHRSGNILKATESAAKSGVVFAYTLMALGMVALFQGAVVVGLWNVLIASFVLIAARSSYQTQLARAVFDNRTVGSLMSRNPLVVEPDMTLSDFVSDIILRRRTNFAPVLEDGVLLGHMDRQLLSGIDRDNWASTRVGDVFVGLEDTPMVGPDLPVQDLLALVAQTGARKFLVVRDHRLLGVITLADLAGSLQQADMRLHERDVPQR